MQKYVNTTHRSVVWLKKAADDGALTLKPPFQRNPVWSPKQQSALIDTILLEYPIPELYFQDVVDAEGKEQHLVVDGQQRVNAVLTFLAGKLELDEESPHWAGMAFDDLTPGDKKKLFEYAFVVRLLPDIPEEQLRAIFQRLNRNTMTLNAQELRHATYWGTFIQLMEKLSDHEFWSESGIFSANDRRRMLDIEFISELACAYLNGFQNKKTKLEDYYRVYEQNFDDSEKVQTAFFKVLGEIDQALPQFRQTRWRKKSDFYTLFLVLAKHESKIPLDADKRKTLEGLLVTFATLVNHQIVLGFDPEQVTADESLLVPITYAASVEKAASDLGSRTTRAEMLETYLAPVLIPPAP